LAVSVSGQMLVFLAACLAGAILGALYDVFRIIRIAIPCGRIAVFIQDIIYLIICTLLTYLFLIMENSGEIRVFIIEGEIIGAIIYYFTIGAVVIKAARLIIIVVKRFLNALYWLVTPRAKSACVKIKAECLQKVIKAKKMLIKNKLFKIRLKPVQNMVYNLIHTINFRKRARKQKQAGEDEV